MMFKVGDISHVLSILVGVLDFKMKRDSYLKSVINNKDNKI